jgi:hypothetical protein
MKLRCQLLGQRPLVVGLEDYCLTPVALSNLLELIKQDGLANAPQPEKDQALRSFARLGTPYRHFSLANNVVATRKRWRSRSSAGVVRVVFFLHVYGSLVMFGQFDQT